MKHEENFTKLSLKEYRSNYAKGLSLEVCKRAADYSKNGHRPQNALATSAAIYADPYKHREFHELGFMAEKQLGAATIWNLQTETPAAQRALLSGDWDYHNRQMCIARLGENYVCTRRTTLEFPSNLIIGVYEHFHRFVGIVSVESLPESALSVPKVQEVANILAMNAVAHYPEYTARRDNYKRNLKRGLNLECPPELVNFRSFLLEQPLRFVVGINEEYGSFRDQQSLVSIANYLSHRGEQLKQELDLITVDVYGDF